MLRVICALVLRKPSLIKNYLVQLISNIIVLFSNVLKAIFQVKNSNILAATPHKTPTVRPPAPYHENYSS